MSKRPVSTVNFHIGDNTYHFEPAAVEAADLPHLLVLFVALTQPRERFDVEGYVDEQGLWHCFVEA